MTHSYIETFTGRRFYPLKASYLDVCIEDIAHALARQCRFAGHVKGFYSVGEHSINVSKLLDEWGLGVEDQLWGLLHDASEAYLVDLPTPLKAAEFGEAYRKAEETLTREIAIKFNLYNWVVPPIVEKADAIMLATEAREFMAYKEENWAGLRAPALDAMYPCLGDVDQVEQAFLARFKRLEKMR